ncbi:hypothetical protein PG985_009596 [Apiospora marii]|uniref:DUF6536 domain-containing protein n=1 Tax=Apiospora marii TaxID=335849 RepID=A0ABR1RGV4_9PEZI
MKVLQAFTEKGWRRTGAINVVLVSVCGLAVLVGLSISVAHKQDSSKLRSTTLYQGQCTKSSRISIMMHLFVNIVSTGILASSNFFMQITTSPTRKEVDRAHMFLRPLDIGLPSWGNLPSLPYFKRVCWLILFLSSIPIHLFFNSAIYNTLYQGEKFNLTIATSAFTNNAPFMLPGASLTPGGASSPVQVYDPTTMKYRNPNSTLYQGYVDGYGTPIQLADYWNPDSGIQRRMDDIALQGSSWKWLKVDECLEDYKSPGYRSTYTDLILTVSSGTDNTNGWRRSQVFDFKNSSLDDMWDSRVPADEVNSLWFSGQCEYPFYKNCSRLLTKYPWNETAHPTVLLLDDGHNSTAGNETKYGYGRLIRKLAFEGCLAKPVDSCQVLVANDLLLAVLVCVAVKIAACVAVLWHQQDASLVTPGDAIESFITRPDIHTRGLATLNDRDCQSLQCSPREALVALDNTSLVSSIRPRRWEKHHRRLLSTVPQGTWFQIYYPSSIALAGIVTALVASQTFGDGSMFADFGRSENVRPVKALDGLGYISTLICVNMPQLILSFVYLVINMLHTRLRAEEEWNMYSLGYKPLRVSYPEGRQTSTYRLQLPYKYSVPLITTSTILHWLVSNSLFISIIDGRQNLKDSTNSVLQEDFHLSKDTFIGAGYSDSSLLILLILGTIFVLSPFFFKGTKLPSGMVFGGTNSLVLSAACHVPRMPASEGRQYFQYFCSTVFMGFGIMLTPCSETSTSASPTYLPNEQLKGGRSSAVKSPYVQIVPLSSDPTWTEDDKEYLIAVSRRPVRWGVTSMPDGLAGKLSVEKDESVMHLSFGSMDHDVQEPEAGALYA